MKANFLDRSIKFFVVLFALASVVLVVGMPFLKHFEKKPQVSTHNLNQTNLGDKPKLIPQGAFEP